MTESDGKGLCLVGMNNFTEISEFVSEGLAVKCLKGRKLESSSNKLFELRVDRG